MTGLVLKLGPRERVMINGVVMENGDRRTRLNVISRDANVLRLRDAIHPEDVKTPVTRVCYIAQMVLAGEAAPDEGKAQLLRGIEQLRFVFSDPESAEQLRTAAEAVSALRFYPALKALRTLLQREQVLLNHAAQGSA
ncbi:flagellar biosynthesis repressor FlbT [Rhodobacteraceae bacterium 2CG4]|uniref:Flagellar biosynthesis repressor FlbT n=1 Tax=Halovulum marinum TaxID=2662447 RepID=A0A6L5Z756_9RHOB|nr:flagellar biosynthesis repressor FlbT [Halovulum marinum]MSU91792.1 flagellar biosynthesis repressor FlbT [Halovulum marinum]